MQTSKTVPVPKICDTQIGKKSWLIFPGEMGCRGANSDNLEEKGKYKFLIDFSFFLDSEFDNVRYQLLQFMS